MKKGLFIAIALCLAGAGAVLWADGRIPTAIDSYLFREGLSPFQDMTLDLWGYIDKTGKAVIPAAYDSAGPFEGGLAIVTMTDERDEVRTLVINKAGKTIIDPADRYELLSGFKEGLASATLPEGGTAFVDPSGKIAQRFNYIELGPLQEGLAPFQDAAGLWGYLDAKGKVTIKAGFGYAFPFSGGLALATLPGKEDSAIVIDKAGKTLREIDPQAESYSDGLSRLQAWDEDGAPSVTFIDQKGKETLKLQAYDRIDAFHEGRALAVKLGSFQGFIDKAGKEVLKLGYEDFTRYSEGLAAVMVDGKVGFIDLSGKMVIQPRFSAALPAMGPEGGLEIGNYMFSDGLCPYLDPETGLWGYMDAAGKTLIEPAFAAANPFKEGLALVYNESIFDEDLAADAEEGWVDLEDLSEEDYYYSGWLFIDKKGETAIDLAYEGLQALTDFSGGMALVADQEDTIFFIDSKGRKAFTPPSSQVKAFGEGLAPYLDLDADDPAWGYLDAKGATAIKPRFQEAWPFSEGLAPVALSDTEGGGYAYIDKAGKIAFRLESRGNPFSGGLALVSAEDGESGKVKAQFMDKKGKVVFSLTKYGYVDDLSSGRALVRGKRNRVGYVDAAGKEIVPPIYRDGNPFSGGLAAVQVGDKVGFIDLNGKMAIQPRFNARYRQLGKGGDFY